jgi:outer membrane protein assembly factor BamB
MYLFLGGKGAVVAISPDDGREVWRTTLVEKKFFTVSGFHYQVTVLDQGSKVFALNGRQLYALDAVSGNILWSINLSETFGADVITISISGKNKPEGYDSGVNFDLPIE